MRSEQGASTILMVLVVVIVGVAGIASASLGMLYVGREKAATAAEAGALAAAVATYPPAASDSPQQAASRLAESNGAQLESCACPVDSSLRPRRVEVVTSVSIDVPLFGSMKLGARAGAEFDPGAWLGL